MARFICLLSPPSDDAPPLGQEVLTAHRAYFQRLLDESTLIAAGPLDNPPGGLLVFEATDPAEARAIVDADPAVADGGHLAQVRQWTVAFGT